MVQVFVAGNRLVKEDSLALKVAERLEGKFPGVGFEEINSLADIGEMPPDLYIIDVAKGIEKVEVVRDLKKLDEVKLVSLHDLDIGTELLLYKKLGKLGRIALVVIPLGFELERAVEESGKVLRNLFGGN